jgi:diaminopimelate decarboxylase
MELSAYERPTIQRHQMGAMNKFGRLSGMAPLTHIDGVAIADLVAEHGSPLFVFSERTQVRRYRELHDAFARRWAKVRIAWSYKTNYLEAICRVFHREGAWAEVVSPFELDKALGAGVPADRIHWNGPYKPDAALMLAIGGGTILHLDNLDELSRVERIAERMRVRPRVAVRINMAVEGLPPWSRFGFNLESSPASRRGWACRS